MSKREFYIKDLVIDDEYGVIKSDLSIQEAAKKMKELGVPDLVVTDESDNVIGVLADFDIVQDIVAEGKGLDSKVTEAVVSITPVSLESKVTDAFKRMQDLEVNVVPVIDKNNKLLGVATIQDCWSFIPDQSVDEIGLIPVSDPNNAEFWLSSVCAILAFLLGIMLPLTGAVGFFSLPTSFTDLFGVAIIGGENDWGLRGQKEMAVIFDKLGVVNRIVIFPQIGHEYPPQLGKQIYQSLDFIWKK